MNTLGIVLIGLVVMTFLWGVLSSNWMLRGDRDPLDLTPADFDLAFTNESFVSLDGIALKGWFVPREGDATIVICHGWGANRSDILERTFFLAKVGGYNLFYLDFRNHGESGSGFTSLTTLEIGDLSAALDHIKMEHPAATRRLALYGMSMGGAVSLSTAARRMDILGVVAESAFGSFREVIIRFGWLFYNTPRFPFALLMLIFARFRLGFNPEKDAPLYWIHRIAPRPILLLQGGADVRMPPSEGERLLSLAGEPKALWTVPGANHGEVAEWGGVEYQDRVLAFYKRAFDGPAA